MLNGCREPPHHAGRAAGRLSEGIGLRARRGRDRPCPGRARCSSAFSHASVDPYQRGRMSEARSYAKPLEIGDVITSQSLGEVVESNDPRFAPGDLVVGQLGWQEYAVARGGSLRQVPPVLEPPTLALHAVGADRHHGVLRAVRRRQAAAGRHGRRLVPRQARSGQIAGQLARLAGCRTVGIAGGPEKVRDLRELYRYDAGDRLQGRRRLGGAARRRVDVYFDNVGGEISQAVHRPAERRRADRDLRPDLPVQRGTPGADVPSRPPDRVPRADAGLPRHRLRAPLRRGSDRGSRAGSRPATFRWTRGRHRGPGKCAARLHRDAERREPRARRWSRSAERCGSRTCVQRALARWFPSASCSSAEQNTVRFV